MPYITVLKVFFFGIILLFATIGFYEELTVKNTALNKWVKARLGHNDFH